jgi:hypothetical protein
MNHVHFTVDGGKGRGSMIVTVLEARKEHAVPASLIGTVQLRLSCRLEHLYYKKNSHQLNNA